MTSLLAGLRVKCVEPVKRNKDGIQWIKHRFPIKGGISLADAMWIDHTEPREHPLVRMLRGRRSG